MSKSTGRFLFWLCTSLFIAGSVAVIVKYTGPISNNEEDKPLTEEAKEINTTVYEDDWFKGSSDADLILIEYTDLECSACASYVSWMDDLVKEFGNHMTLVVRHYPLENIHVHAKKAAQANEAAGLQDKFWEMQSIIFENQADWAVSEDPYPLFKEYAQEVGVDVVQFETDYASEAVLAEVEQDIARGKASGINATPTFYLNGERLRASSFSQFRDTIRAELRN